MVITEHSVLPALGSFNPFERSAQFPDGLLLNAHASSYDQKYFFVWSKDDNCYKASYVIGAQRINGEELVIQPKMKNIDFMKMFSNIKNMHMTPIHVNPSKFSHICNTIK